MKKKKIPWLAKVFHPKMFFYDFVKWTAAPSAVLYLRTKVIYENKAAKRFRKNPCIIASNHISYEDPIILNGLMLHRRLCCVITEDLYATKFGKWFLSKVGCVPINKKNVSVKSFKDVKNVIAHGHFVGIFPEGQVMRDGTLEGFKSGAVMMALLCETDIVPVYIVRRKNKLRRQVVAVGEKIDIKKYFPSKFATIEEIEAVSKIIRDKELELKEKCKKYER